MSDDGEGGWGRSLSMRVVVDCASRCVVGIEVVILRCRDKDEATTSSGFAHSPHRSKLAIWEVVAAFSTAPLVAWGINGSNRMYCRACGSHDKCVECAHDGLAL